MTSPSAHLCAERVSLAPARPLLGLKERWLLFRKAVSIKVGEGHFASATPTLKLKPGLEVPSCTPKEPEWSQKAAINSSRLLSTPYHNLVSKQYLPYGTGAQRGFLVKVT